MPLFFQLRGQSNQKLLWKIQSKFLLRHQQFPIHLRQNLFFQGRSALIQQHLPSFIILQLLFIQILIIFIHPHLQSPTYSPLPHMSSQISHFHSKIAIFLRNFLHNPSDRIQTIRKNSTRDQRNKNNINSLLRCCWNNIAIAKCNHSYYGPINTRNIVIEPIIILLLELYNPSDCLWIFFDLNNMLVVEKTTDKMSDVKDRNYKLY